MTRIGTGRGTIRDATTKTRNNFVRIETLDPIYSRVINRHDFPAVEEILRYRAEKAQRTIYGGIKVSMVDKSALDCRSGMFLTGFLPRVIRTLKNKGIPCLIQGDLERSDIIVPPYLPGVEARPDQKDLLEIIAEQQRGYIKAPTGSGKTVLAGFIHSMFQGARTLFLCHTIDLLMQSADEFRRWGFDVQVVGGGQKDLDKIKRDQIVVATIQTFSKLPGLFGLADVFDVLIIDECHHITKKDGMYGTILERSLAPVRIGLTATDENANHFLEGYLGEKIGEFKIQDGINSGVLATPEVHWVNVPVDDDIHNIQKYADIYKRAIVNNRSRNRMVISQAKKHVDEGRSVLTFVQMVEHGNNLMKMAEILDLPTEFVWGGTEKAMRDRIKISLEKKHIHHVIASCVWNEGINIRSLDVVNNAAGGKKEVRTIQKIGRGLRTTETKDSVILIDYLDPYKYLSHHAMMRMRVYVEFGWTMKSGDII